MTDPTKDPDYTLYETYQAGIKKIDEQISVATSDNECMILDRRKQKLLTKSNKAMGRFLMRWQPLVMTEEELQREYQRVRNLIANAGMEFTLDEIKQGKHYQI